MVLAKAGSWRRAVAVKLASARSNEREETRFKLGYSVQNPIFWLGKKQMRNTRLRRPPPPFLLSGQRGGSARTFLRKPAGGWMRNPQTNAGNENRTHTPPTPHHHRVFDDDGAAAASTRASPALALRMTFHINPMAHV